MALAAASDLEARLGRALTADETAKAEALLADASALVTGYTRRSFELVADDEIVLREVRGVLRLPQRPVQSVASVTAIGCDGLGLPDIPIATWCFDGVDQVDVRGWRDSAVNLPEWLLGDAVSCTYRVVYTHGDEEVPPDVVAVVCGMVSRVLLSPSAVEGMVSERIGQYTYQMQQGMGAAGPVVRLSASDREVLDRYRRTATGVLTPAGR